MKRYTQATLHPGSHSPQVITVGQDCIDLSVNDTSGVLTMQIDTMNFIEFNNWISARGKVEATSAADPSDSPALPPQRKASPSR